MMSLLPFWALNVSVPLLSMQSQKALGLDQKYLNSYTIALYNSVFYIIVSIYFIFITTAF